MVYFGNNGNGIVSTNGIAHNRSGGLAGSTLTMEMAIKKMMVFTGFPLEWAIPMATSTSAKAMSIADRKCRIAPGFDVGVVILDKDLNVFQAFVGEKSV